MCFKHLTLCYNNVLFCAYNSRLRLAPNRIAKMWCFFPFFSFFISFSFYYYKFIRFYCYWQPMQIVLTDIHIALIWNNLCDPCLSLSSNILISLLLSIFHTLSFFYLDTFSFLFSHTMKQTYAFTATSQPMAFPPLNTCLIVKPTHNNMAFVAPTPLTTISALKFLVYYFHQ